MIPYPTPDAFAVTPSDSAVQSAYYLWTIDGGDIAVETEAGETVKFEQVPAGSFIPVSVNRVLATGTTATKIYAFRD